MFRQGTLDAVILPASSRSQSDFHLCVWWYLPLTFTAQGQGFSDLGSGPRVLLDSLMIRLGSLGDLSLNSAHVTEGGRRTAGLRGSQAASKLQRLSRARAA